MGAVYITYKTCSSTGESKSVLSGI